MMLAMVIRNAVKEDIPQLIELLSEVLEVHAEIRPDLFISGATKYTSMELEKMLLDKDMMIDVIAEKELLLGYAFYNVRSPKFTHTMKDHRMLFVDDFSIRKEYHHKHLGKALFSHLKEKAKELHCDQVVLSCWEGNDGARAFYKAMGMKPRTTTMELYVGDSIR